MSEAVDVEEVYESMTDLQLDAAYCALLDSSLARALKSVAENRFKEDEPSDA